MCVRIAVVADSITRLRSAIAGDLFDLFGPPDIGVGVGPRRALQFCSSSWFGQAEKAVAEKKAAENKAAEEEAQVRSHTGCITCPPCNAVDPRAPPPL